MSERIDVFISSTSRNLPEHRKQVMDACLRMGMFPIMMEHLPTSDADAIEASLKMVDDAEVYVGVFAWRYGYTPAGHDISITEMEYNRAVERGIPRLIFIMHEDHAVKGSDVEKGVGAAKLEAFRGRLLAEQVVNFYKSPEDLRGQVIHGLVPHRVSDSGSLHSRYASEIPLPPEPYIAHPYTLLQTSDLIGRKKELAMLTGWATKSDTSVFNFVVAIGGMGKSALTWKWFNDIAPTVMPDLAGRMWWSFYESDASFENFVIRALAYVSQRSKEEIEEIPPSDREAQLLSILDKEPFLLVWDGFERTMLAYARMDAARMTDDDLDEKTANPSVRSMGMPGEPLADKSPLRKATDSRVSEFLRKLAQAGASRILVSTRLYPAELQTDTGEPLPGSAAFFLRGLADDDALSLWHALGVNGSPDTLLPLFHLFENHPLLIRALAGEVAKYRRAPGQFDQWHRAYPNFKPFDLPLIRVKTHILTFALQGLSASGQRVLQTVAAFRMPASYDTLAALLVGESRLLAAEYELDTVLTELEDRGLLGWDKRANRYDLHPVVRGVVWTMFSDVTREDVYENMAAYFEALPTSDEDASSFDDLAPAIELYNALIGLKRYDDAFHVFYNRLSRAMQYRWSANRQKAELLEMLFPDGIEQLPRLKKVSSQAFALGHLARSYKLSGYPARAVPLYQRNLTVRENSKKAEVLKAVVLGQLADVMRVSGQLYEAELAARRAFCASREIKDTMWAADSLKWLSSVLAACGAVDEAAVMLQRAIDIFSEQNHRSLLSAAYARVAQHHLWQRQYREAEETANLTWNLSMQIKNEHDVIRAVRLQGESALGLGDFEKASTLLHEILIHARTSSLIEEELPILVALAEWARIQGYSGRAKASLGGLWELAERGPYPLFHADALNVLAQIERDEGNTAAAIDAATRAYEKAWCDGPPYAYHWGLEAARKHLDELGAPYPDMRPFDPSKYDPMPEVDINPLDELHRDE